MGLLVMKRGHIKAKTDYMKLRLLFTNPLTKKTLQYLLASTDGGKTRLEDLMDRIATGEKPQKFLERPVYSLVQTVAKAIGIPKEKLSEYMAHPNIRRTILNAALSVQEYGLNLPMTFYAPLMIVWNITYTCNLRCKHCYENAGSLRPKELGMGELSREEKLRLVDEIADSHIPTLSFSGGEPLLCKDFWAVVEKARERGLYLSMNSNGVLITPEIARRLKENDFAYVAVSIDSANPEKHDFFRGVKGAWERSIQGIKNIIEAGGNAILSVTVTKYNYDEFQDILELGKKLGVYKVMVYNFIPTGRGKEIWNSDLTPEEKESILQQMYDFLGEGGSLCTTAPQLGRICLDRDKPEFAPIAHLGTGKAKDLSLLAELIGGCGVARAYMAIQPDGTITPCVYMPEVHLGHIKTDRILDVWHNHPFLNRLRDRKLLSGACGSCEFNKACGGCRARALAYFGDPMAPDPGCIKNKEYYENFVKMHPEIYQSIQDENLYNNVEGRI
ncbi:radical SAM protein [bacterium]|nr:radical SAM protein [bacterium]